MDLYWPFLHFILYYSWSSSFFPANFDVTGQYFLKKKKMTSFVDVIIFFFISLNHKIRTLMISFEKSRWHSKYNASFSPCNNKTTMICTFAKRSYQNVSFFYEIYLGWWNFIGSLAACFFVLFCLSKWLPAHLDVTSRVSFYKISSTAWYKKLQRNKFKGRKVLFFVFSLENRPLNCLYI